MPDEGSAPAPDNAEIAAASGDDDLLIAHALLADELDAEGLGAQTVPELLPPGGPLRPVFRALGQVEQAVGASLLVIILTLVLIQVAQRYLPGGGWAWTGEIARFSMVWVTFVLSGYLMATDGHIAIKVVDLFFPPRALGVVLLAGHLLIAVVSVAMVYATIEFITNDRGQVTAAAGIPLSVIYAVPALGFASTALRALLAVVVLDLPQAAGRREATA